MARNAPWDGLQCFCLIRRYKGAASCPKDQFLVHSHFARCRAIGNWEQTDLAEGLCFILHLIRRPCLTPRWLLGLSRCEATATVKKFLTTLKGSGYFVCYKLCCKIICNKQTGQSRKWTGSDGKNVWMIKVWKATSCYIRNEGFSMK